VGSLGANAHGEVLEAGRVPDCYLGRLLFLPQCSVSDLDGRGVQDRAAGRPVDRDVRQLVFSIHAAAVAGR
jgi:hypothetical protein